jgi:hypothetical protein
MRSTFVKHIFVLLRLPTAASGRVDLVTNTTKEATSPALVVVTTLLVLSTRLLLVVVVAAGEGGEGLVNLVHGGGSGQSDQLWSF